jgi:excisionase family DNA binding protein
MLVFHINASMCHSVQEVKEFSAMAITFSVKNAAAQCDLSERTIHNAIKDGRLPALRVGRRVLVTAAALQDFLNGKTVPSKEGR